MKLRFLILNFVFMIVDVYFIVMGDLNFNSIFHQHIASIFIGHSNGYLGLFWLVCCIHDVVIFNLIILMGYFVRKRIKVSNRLLKK